jgi:outer membrane protein
MKKVLITIAVLIAFSMLAWCETKVAVVNPQQILQQSLKGKAAIERLNTLTQSKAKRFEGLQKELETLRKDVASPALNQEARDKKTIEIQNKEVELKRFTEDAEAEVNKMQAKEFEALTNELMPIIAQVAKENGLSLVLDITVRGIAYADPTIDITDKVIKLYDAKSAAPAAAPAPKK